MCIWNIIPKSTKRISEKWCQGKSFLSTFSGFMEIPCRDGKLWVDLLKSRMYSVCSHKCGFFSWFLMNTQPVCEENNKTHTLPQSLHLKKIGEYNLKKNIYGCGYVQWHEKIPFSDFALIYKNKYQLIRNLKNEENLTKKWKAWFERQLN